MQLVPPDDVRVFRAGYAIGRCHAALFSQLKLLKEGAKLAGFYDTAEYRDLFSELQAIGSSKLLHALGHELAIKLDFTFEGIPRVVGKRKPMIIVSNHESTVDILALFTAADLERIHTRWVMKRELEGTPYGWAGVETNAAFVSRDGTEGDVSKILACGWSAYADSASVVIFPEGTRFHSTKVGSKYQNVLAPRVGGFSALCDAMPDADVLSVTLHWSGGGVGLGQAYADAKRLIGRRLTVHGKLVSRAQVERNRRVWLNEEWDWKDRFIADLKNQEGFQEAA